MGIYNGIAIPRGKVSRETLMKCDLKTVEGRIKYYRFIAGYTSKQMAEKLGMKRASEYTNTFEYIGKNGPIYSAMEKYKRVCVILGIEFNAIADEYMMFLDSNYDELLRDAISISGLSIWQFAVRHKLNYSTLLNSLMKKYKLSEATVNQYIEVLRGYGLYKAK